MSSRPLKNNASAPSICQAVFVILSRLKKKGKYSLVFFLWICYDSYEKKDKTFKTKVREPMQMDLTRGGITRPMLLFAGPMIAGNLLQQCYNIADTLIVGRALGASALASVGFSFTLMTFLTSVLLGLCMGSGALWSMLYGAEREEELKRCLFASFVFIGSVAVLLNVGVLALLEPVMTLLRIPAGAWDETRAYLRVVLLGVCFTFLYNYFACLLRSVGNSVAPLAFLAVSTVLNIGLDLWFVLGLGWGVAGAAGATVLAQGVSAAGIALYGWRRVPLLRLERRHCKVSRGELGRIMNYSLLTCVQQSVMNFGILMVQGLVNSFGVNVMAAFAAAVKIDAFAYLPVQDFGNAFSTFVAQNTGAQKTERIRRGIRSAVGVSIGFCLVSSDSDFTRLAARLRESRMFVIGMGESKTPTAFKAACDTFKYLDVLMGLKKDAAQQAGAEKAEKAEKPKAAKKQPARAAKKQVEKAKPAAKDAKEAKEPKEPKPDARPAEPHHDEELAAAFVPLDEIVEKVREIIDFDSDEDGYMPLSQIGIMLGRLYADFDSRNYGFSKLHKLIEHTGAFETKYEQLENGSKNLVVRNK